MSLASLFCPRGVAVVGSTAEGKLGYELIRQIVAGGYAPVYAVNPKAQGLATVPGYRSVSEIGQPVDMAVIASPAPSVPDVLADCGQAGVQAAVIITAGFAEAGNTAGEEAVKAAARRHAIRYVGPNCAGILNTHHRLLATLETQPPPGAVAFVSQSGALGGAVLYWAHEQGLGFSKFVSYGNGSDLNESELLAYLAEDPETRVVALYIESVADGRAFLQAAQAVSRVKPLVVIKSGRGRAGQRATLSHTGSLAGADAVYAAALQQAGAIRVETVEEMFDLCRAFVALAPVRGRRAVVVTNSGGPGVLAADRGEEVGLALDEPSPALRQTLAAFLPGHCALRNPIDLTVEGTEDGYRRTLAAALQEYDCALAINVCPPYLDSLPLARGVIAAVRESGKPVLASFVAGKNVDESIALLEAQGIPNYPVGERAMAVLARMAEREARRGGMRSLPVVGTPPLRSGLGVREPPPGAGLRLPPEGPLLEPDAMAWLRALGIPVPELRRAAGADEAAAACRELGFPAVMKVVAPEILHKTDAGGVVLGIGDEAAARAAFEAIRAAAAGRGFRGVVIYPQLQGGQEVLVGLSRDPQFGPVVAFGLGGVYAEIWRDVALRVAPVDHVTALEMIHGIRSIGLLTGARGRPPCDLEALADLLVRVSELPFHYPEVAEVDLNPVFVFPEGVRVADVRVIRQGQEA